MVCIDEEAGAREAVTKACVDWAAGACGTPKWWCRGSSAANTLLGPQSLDRSITVDYRLFRT